jgi:hypothetical protein
MALSAAELQKVSPPDSRRHGWTVMFAAGGLIPRSVAPREQEARSPDPELV